MFRYVYRKMHMPRYLKNLKNFKIFDLQMFRLWLCHFSPIDNVNMQAFLSVLDILIERSMIRT